MLVELLNFFIWCCRRGSEKAVTNLNHVSYFRNNQETLNSNQVHRATEESSMNPFNQSFILEQSRVSSCPDLTREGVETNYDGALGPVSYNYPSSMVQGLLETSTKTQQSIYNEQSNTTSYSQLLQPSWRKFPHEFLQSPSSKQNQSNQLQLSNDTPFWNASIPSQFVAQIHEPKSSSSNLIERVRFELWRCIQTILILLNLFSYDFSFCFLASLFLFFFSFLFFYDTVESRSWCSRIMLFCLQ